VRPAGSGRLRASRAASTQLRRGSEGELGAGDSRSSRPMGAAGTYRQTGAMLGELGERLAT